ncbi:MAG: adenylate/guanylate cyclase domain-containing protein [Candidatus Binatus sp.]|uniref:ATP-binding protein n=1 Tax=Candidatus Binatus sp. TaxID=2811406 RepID=UPI003BB136BF
MRVAAESSSPENLEGERKTVTALFADIKGSTELEQDLDPEEARAIVDPALNLMIDAVRRYDGYIVQSTGDGIFALFGAPIAHEEHPQRALYAALRMQEELKRYSARLREAGNLPLEARVGVNTGEVVVRSIATGEGHTEYTPIGHTNNLASRMQSLAPTGSIAISEQTRKFVEGYFTLKPLGPTRVKGVSEPINVYEVTGLGPLRTRLQRSASRGYTKFVGRERQMDALCHAAELARQGHGQIVAAVADPGVGKSRLFYEFKARNQSGWMVLESFSVSHGKASAYFAVIDLLYNYFKILGEDDQRARRAKVTGNVLTLDRALEDTLPYVLALLGIADQDDPLAGMDAQIRKRRTLDAIKRVLLRESLNQPLMLMFEDLHWIDEETQAFLNLLADSIGTAKISLLVNYRPEYQHQWDRKTYYTQLRLDPLGKDGAEEMLAALLGEGKDLIPLKRLIIVRTEGNPFFMEETVQVLLDEGALVRDGAAIKVTKSLNELKIPLTVQGILAARIDRLPAAEKELLQTVAVIGKDFPLALVREITKKPDDEIDSMLNNLQLAEFIYEQPAVGDLQYTFKHALTHDVAYNSVLIERRKLLHERVGSAMEASFAQSIDDHLSQLAYHYGRSANVRKALEYLGLAGQQAHRRLAHSEVIVHLNAALQLLKSLPEDDERRREEASLQITFAEAAGAARGPADDEVGAALVRARDLCTQLGDTRRLFRVLLGLRYFYNFKSQWQNDLETSQQLLALAEREPGPAKRLWANTALGDILEFLGRHRDARAHLEKAIALIPAIAEHTVFPVADPRIAALCMYGEVLWWLGFPDQALERCREALTLARKLGRPFVLCSAYSGVCTVYRDRGEVSALEEAANEMSVLADEHGFGLYRAEGTYWRAWCLLKKGSVEEGLNEVQRIMAARRAEALAAGGALFDAFEAYRKLRRFDEALALLDQTTWTPRFSSAVKRVRGELQLEAGRCSEREAEDLFRDAIRIARSEEARSFELLATTSLARLLAKQGHRDEARAMLAEIYGWFTEGFDTADLKDAKALLDQLG